MHVAPAGKDAFEFLDCTTETYIEEIKRQVEELGRLSGDYSLPAEQQELWFMDEECKDGRQLKHYSICHDWIVQVSCWGGSGGGLGCGGRALHVLQGA